jgi:hypothetical protein
MSERDTHGNPIIGGNALKPTVEWEMDGEARVATILYRPPLALESTRIGLPFLMLKEAACQILIFEADLAAMVYERAKQPVPAGVRAKKHAALQLHREIEEEKARIRTGVQSSAPTELEDGPKRPSAPDKHGMDDIL